MAVIYTFYGRYSRRTLLSNDGFSPNIQAFLFLFPAFYSLGKQYCTTVNHRKALFDKLTCKIALD